ncbi:MAG: hypothetical protein ACRDTT_17005 [Pseudonocardiaceae bacterium]
MREDSEPDWARRERALEAYVKSAVAERARDLVDEWIELHPSGTVDEFRIYMRAFAQKARDAWQQLDAMTTDLDSR